MGIRIVIPVEDEGGLDAVVSQHFGRAPYFVVVDLDDEGRVLELQTIPNTSEHFGGFGRPPDRILQLQPDAVATYGMGPRALNIFQDAGVAVLKTEARTVREVISAFNRGELVELTEGCLEAHHFYQPP